MIAVPNALADYSWKSAQGGFAAFNSHNFTSDNRFAENFPRENAEPRSDYRTVSLATSKPAEASPVPGQSSCAPVFRSFGSSYTIYWYDLLNNEGFAGTSCSPDWVFPNGLQPTYGTVCVGDVIPRTAYYVAVPSTNPTFSQDFSVPSGITKPLEISIRFQTFGSSTWWDRIILQLWEGSTFKELKQVTPSQYCNSSDFTFSSSYAGKNMKLVVAGSILTSGVEYHIDHIQIRAYQ
jgi:hypothetical protein